VADLTMRKHGERLQSMQCEPATYARSHGISHGFLRLPANPLEIGWLFAYPALLNTTRPAMPEPAKV
jgi:hypothetical protein